jgi:hypothetical protein
VAYSSAANSQFERRWDEANSGHEEKNLQHEYQQVHDALLRLLSAEQSENE